MSDPISASKPHLSTGVSCYKPHYWLNDRNTLAGNVADGNVCERQRGEEKVGNGRQRGSHARLCAGCWYVLTPYETF